MEIMSNFSSNSFNDTFRFTGNKTSPLKRPLFVTNDEEYNDRTKKRLIQTFENLSLVPENRQSSRKTTSGSEKTLKNDDKHTVYIPSIDEFLATEEQEELAAQSRDYNLLLKEQKVVDDDNDVNIDDEDNVYTNNDDNDDDEYDDDDDLDSLDSGSSGYNTMSESEFEDFSSSSLQNTILSPKGESKIRKRKSRRRRSLRRSPGRSGLISDDESFGGISIDSRYLKSLPFSKLSNPIISPHSKLTKEENTFLLLNNSMNVPQGLTFNLIDDQDSHYYEKRSHELILYHPTGEELVFKTWVQWMQMAQQNNQAFFGSFDDNNDMEIDEDGALYRSYNNLSNSVLDDDDAMDTD